MQFIIFYTHVHTCSQGRRHRVRAPPGFSYMILIIENNNDRFAIGTACLTAFCFIFDMEALNTQFKGCLLDCFDWKLLHCACCFDSRLSGDVSVSRKSLQCVLSDEIIIAQLVQNFDCFAAKICSFEKL